MRDDLDFDFSILITDLNGKILDCNKTFEGLSGYYKKELKDLDIEKIIKKDTLLTRNGNIKIHYDVFPLIKENIVIYVIYDIEKIEEILEENLLIFQDAPIPIIELDIEELIDYLNTLRKIIGENLETYFITYPEAIFDFIHKLKVVKVNKFFEKGYMGFSFEKFKKNLFNYFTPQSIEIVKREIIKFYNGDKN
jgi:hypothetical protein